MIECVTVILFWILERVFSFFLCNRMCIVFCSVFGNGTAFTLYVLVLYSYRYLIAIVSFIPTHNHYVCTSSVHFLRRKASVE